LQSQTLTVKLARTNHTTLINLLELFMVGLSEIWLFINTPSEKRIER